MYKHILIATDGSELARKGLDQGLSLAQALRARVTIVTVTETLRYFPDGMTPDYGGSGTLLAEYETGQVEIADAILATAQKLADRREVTATTVHVRDAAPAEAITAAAKSRECDLIVMASHGRRGVRRLVLGSVTSEVLALSDKPVLVVR